jgi:hypothetical protein
VRSIGNDRLGLTLAPDYGARVVALTDRNTDRQWLVTGPQSSRTGDDAVYGADEAVGWDECFPTVLACDHPAWDAPLRDHGALWGRTWVVDLDETDCVETRFQTSRFRFSRRLTLAGATVVADYRATNLGAAPLPYLWSQHCLLATKPGDRIVLSGHERLRAGDDPFVWPNHQGRDLSIVGPLEEGFAIKAYSQTPGHASAAIKGSDGGITFDWDGVPAFGLWLCYGGWPEGNPVHQVALEPTTAAADHLAAADALGQARWLGVAKTHIWSVRMTVTDPDERTLQ